jgi:YHS domain-containing protein
MTTLTVGRTKEQKEEICNCCGGKINEESNYKNTHTYQGYIFCNYECMEAFYNNEIPEEEDFLSVNR